MQKRIDKESLLDSAVNPHGNIPPVRFHLPIRFLEICAAGRRRLWEPRCAGCQKKAPAGEEQRALLTGGGRKSGQSPSGTTVFWTVTVLN